MQPPRLRRRRARLRRPARRRGPGGDRTRVLHRPPRRAGADQADRGDDVTELTPMQAELCEQSETDYSDLKAFFVNCTLKRSPEVSNTQGLMDISMEIMRRNGVGVECIRAVDHEIATGVWPDMTEHGWDVGGGP